MPTTVNYSWTTPVVGSSTDTWGGILNTLAVDIDADLKLVSDSVSTRLVASNNLSDLGDAAVARTNLGLVIGTDVQAYNATLASLSGLSLVADRGLYATGANTLTSFVLTAAARTLLDDASTAAMRTTLGLDTAATYAIGTSGGTVPLLNGANTWAAKQTFSVVPAMAGLTAARVASGTATNSGRISWGTASPGTLAEGEIYLQHVE